MGGNALNSTFTRRYQKDEYFQLETEIFNHLKHLDASKNLKVTNIQAYSSKTSFGDMDFLIEYQEGVDYLNIVNSFQPNEVFSNGKVISFDYKQLQIDMIITKPEFFDFSKTYYSFNDLGNLIGRIAHKMGMKYGHEGLYYTYRDNNKNILGKICLTKDAQKAFAILDYDHERFLQGFDTLEDIFEYVISSKFFNPDIFAFHNRNHQARTRDRKRPTYNAFLTYCDDNKDSFEHKYEYNSDKSTYFAYIQSYFPQFYDEMKKYNLIHQRKAEIREKFNGSLVMKLTNLKGKELGQFMSTIKTPDFEHFVLTSTDEEIAQYITTFKELK